MKAKQTIKPGRGGAREGAGRPAGEPTTARLIKLTDEQWATALRLGGGYTEGLRLLLDQAGTPAAAIAAQQTPKAPRGT